jgi:hypothetical protein
VLRGRQGLITDYMVMLPAQGLDLPPLPPEQVATNRVAVEKKPTPAKAPVVVAPLIISGTKVLSAPITNEVPGEIQKP